MNKASPGWLLALLLTLCFTLATVFVPRAQWWNAVPRAADWNRAQSQSDNVFKLLFGEGRRLFANEMYDMADAYFHSGYYPSIFDKSVTDHDVGNAAEGKTEAEDSTSDDFLGPPPDWLAALERQFVPNRHTHLDAGGPTGQMKSSSVQEILPWLKLATDLNPQYITPYEVGDYWLCRLHKPEEAQQFLLEGLRNNPGNIELLFDLGWLYQNDFHDANRARNVWMAGLRSWERQGASARANTEAELAYEESAMNLANLEEAGGHWSQAVEYLKIVKQVSPNPDAVQKQIDEVEKKIGGPPGVSKP